MKSKNHDHITPLAHKSARNVTAESTTYFSATTSATNAYPLSAGATASHGASSHTSNDDDPPMSQYAASVLSAPQVVLFISASPESQQAFKLLEEAGIRFAARIANDEDAPSAAWGDGCFSGIAAIKDLAKTIQKVHRTLAKKLSKGLPPEFGAPDPRVALWMEQLRARQLAEARAVLQDALVQASRK